MLNNLYKTKAYLVGGIQYTNGRLWRDEIIEKLKSLEIICFNPFSKPFIKDVDENENIQQKLLELIEEENYDEVARRTKLIRIYDLALVDKSDFIIAHLDPKVPTAGTYEEIFWANRLKKPIFLIVPSKKTCPIWLFGTIPHKYIYESVDEVVNILQKIDAGEKEMDSDRWKLLKKEFR